jgi:hypothetical protein
MPSETLSGLSVKAFAGSWQVAQATWPVELKRLSWKSLSPSAIFSGVCGLSAGIGRGGRPSGEDLATLRRQHQPALPADPPELLEPADLRLVVHDPRPRHGVSRLRRDD